MIFVFCEVFVDSYIPVILRKSVSNIGLSGVAEDFLDGKKTWQVFPQTCDLEGSRYQVC